MEVHMKFNNRFWWSVAAVWATLFVTDWVFHGWWLAQLYTDTAQFWRPQGEVGMYWAWIGNFIFAWAFVWMFKKGISNASPWHQAFRYGIAVLLVAKIPSALGNWAYTAYPAELVWKWAFIWTVQVLACAFVMAWIFRKEIPWNSSTSHTAYGK
jgi:hypothetical protein